MFSTTMLIALHALLFLDGTAAARFHHAALKDAVMHAHPRRQAVPIIARATKLSSSSTTVPTTYTVITPSPSASPIAITKQSQVITTYIPQITLCAMGIASTTTRHGNYSRTLLGGSMAPYTNHSPPYSSSEACRTSYSPKITTICATVLQGIATSLEVTACHQQVTFSSQYGYVLSIPAGNISTMTPSPAVQTQTTYFVAPWQALTSGLTPANVTEKICSAVPTTNAQHKPVNATQCVDIHEIWQTSTITVITSTTSIVDLTTTIPGPSKLIIETFQANITEMMTELSLSTRMVLEFSTEKVSTVVSTIASTTTITGPTVSRTVTLLDAPGDVTSTITQIITSTIYSSTTTSITMSPSSSPL